MVYEAERILDGGMVLPAACKVISPALAARDDVAQRFRREAALCIGLSGDHPNLVTVYDLHRDDEGRLLLAMELVDGAPLSALLRGVPLPPPIVRRLVHDILQGLAHVHAADVVHRDVSPENILVSRQGAVKLSDFGLSKVLSDTSHQSQPTFKGKAAYASPEAIHGNALDARADLWSLAAVVHELLSGAPPFGRGDIWHILSVQTESGPAALPAEVPADLRALTADLAVLVSDERQFQRAADMLRVLEEMPGPVSTRAELGAFVAEMCRTSREPCGDADARADTQQPPAAQPQAHAPAHDRSRTTDHGLEPPPAHYAPTPLPLPAQSRSTRGWTVLALLGAVLVGGALSFAMVRGNAAGSSQPATSAPDAGAEATRSVGAEPMQAQPVTRPEPALDTPRPPAREPDGMAPTGSEHAPAASRRHRRSASPMSPAGPRGRTAEQVPHDERLPSQRHQEVHLAPRSSIME